MELPPYDTNSLLTDEKDRHSSICGYCLSQFATKSTTSVFYKLSILQRTPIL